PAWSGKNPPVLHKIPYNPKESSRNAVFVSMQNDIRGVFLHIKSEPARQRCRALFTHTRRIKK
ncbi:MAG: hypothetical protein ACI33O_07530, partial [Bhargavaea sp.]